MLIIFSPINVITKATIQSQILWSLCFPLKTPNEKGNCSNVRFGAPACRLCQGGRPVGLCPGQGFPGALPWQGPLRGSLESSKVLSSLSTHLPRPQLTDTRWMATDLLGSASGSPAPAVSALCGPSAPVALLASSHSTFPSQSPGRQEHPVPWRGQGPP